MFVICIVVILPIALSYFSSETPSTVEPIADIPPVITKDTQQLQPTTESIEPNQIEINDARFWASQESNCDKIEDRINMSDGKIREIWMIRYIEVGCTA